MMKCVSIKATRLCDSSFIKDTTKKITEKSCLKASFSVKNYITHNPPWIYPSENYGYHGNEIQGKRPHEQPPTPMKHCEWRKHIHSHLFMFII